MMMREGLRMVLKLEKDIQSTGFFRNKAKNIQGACSRLAKEFGGELKLKNADPGTLLEVTIPAKVVGAIM